VERLMDFRRRQKTILFCSHSMFLINELCDHCLWLAAGRVQGNGDTVAVVRSYMASLKRPAAQTETPPDAGAGQAAPEPEQSGALPEVIVESLELVDDHGRPRTKGRQFERLVLRYRTRCSGSPVTGHLGLGIIDAENQPLFTSLTHHLKMEPIVFSGLQEGRLVIPKMLLQGEKFRAVLVVFDIHGVRTIDACYSAAFGIEGERPELGLVWMEHQWQ